MLHRLGLVSQIAFLVSLFACAVDPPTTSTDTEDLRGAGAATACSSIPHYAANGAYTGCSVTNTDGNAWSYPDDSLSEGCCIAYCEPHFPPNPLLDDPHGAFDDTCWEEISALK